MSPSEQLMLRVKVNRGDHEPIDLPEFVAGGREWEDSPVDEVADVAYVSTHRENTIDRVFLEHHCNREGTTVIAGEPRTLNTHRPVGGRLGREPGDYGRIAYVHNGRQHGCSARRRTGHGKGATG